MSEKILCNLNVTVFFVIFYSFYDNKNFNSLKSTFDIFMQGSYHILTIFKS